MQQKMHALKAVFGRLYSGLQTLNMAAIAEGIAQGAIAEAIQYVNQRVQFGKTIAQFQNTQHVVAELLAKANPQEHLYGARQK